MKRAIAQHVPFKIEKTEEDSLEMEQAHLLQPLQSEITAQLVKGDIVVQIVPESLSSPPNIVWNSGQVEPASTIALNDLRITLMCQNQMQVTEPHQNGMFPT